MNRLGPFYGYIEPSGEELTRLLRENFYRQYGGKEAYEQRMAEERAAREAMPKVPDLKEVLAILWAERAGEVWADLPEVERHVRLAEMDRQIYCAANPHYHG